MKHRLEIISGEGRGKELGFPTLNFKVTEDFSYQFGVYAGWVTLGDERYPAAIHYGPIPVFGEYFPALEAHVIDQVLTGEFKEAELEIDEYIRDVKSVKAKELIKQITEDVKKIKKILEV